MPHGGRLRLPAQDPHGRRWRLLLPSPARCCGNCPAMRRTHLRGDGEVKNSTPSSSCCTGRDGRQNRGAHAHQSAAAAAMAASGQYRHAHRPACPVPDPARQAARQVTGSHCARWAAIGGRCRNGHEAAPVWARQLGHSRASASLHPVPLPSLVAPLSMLTWMPAAARRRARRYSIGALGNLQPVHHYCTQAEVGGHQHRVLLLWIGPINATQA